MAEQHTYEARHSGRSGGALAFITGGLVVAVAVLAYFIFGGMEQFQSGSGSTPSNIEINATSDSAAGAEAADDSAAAGASAETDGGEAAAGATASE